MGQMRVHQTGPWVIFSCPLYGVQFNRGIGQCIGRRKSRNLKQTFSRRLKRKVPDFLRNQELFGGDYWTRTSDLLRVKYSIILSQNIVEGSNRVISRKIETSIEEKSQKLF